MSDPIIPFAVWAPGTNENSIPANDNSLRHQILNGLVISATTTAQPGSPAEGAIYIIPASATGAVWSTLTVADLVIYSSGTWYAFAPVNGIVVNVAGTLKRWNGTAYVDAGGGSAVAVPIGVAVSDETTALTTGTAKATFRVPYAFTLTGVRASVTTAPTGSTIIVDINQNGASILSTRLSIDASEKTSTTAATPAVISDTTLDDDAEITIDIDQVGSTVAGAGLKVWLIGNKTP